MEITDKGACISLNRYSRQERVATGGKSAHARKGPSTGAADTVALSDSVLEIRNARDTIDALPEIREDAVARLREKVADGTYEIDSGRIADEMIAGALSDGIASTDR